MKLGALLLVIAAFVIALPMTFPDQFAALLR
jgi:hypothetical protein